MNDPVDYTLTKTVSILQALLEYAVGGWTILLQVLVIFVLADWVSGWLAAWMNGELQSRIIHEGMIRKVMIFMLVWIAHLIDGILGDGHYIRDAVIFFYLATELLSIIENVGRMGLPMPGVLMNAVKIFQSKSGDSEEGKENTGMK